MTDTVEKLAWTVVFALLVTFSIPWFLWGNDGIAYGLPIWLWWHVGWMGVAALAFGVFTRRAWGLGVTEAGDV